MSNPSDLILPVILSGGSGTRLWPISRRHRPKQFIDLMSNEPLIVDTARRVSDSGRFLPPVFIANDEHRFMIAEAMRTAALDCGEIVLEPDGRNTAAPVCVAALIAAQAHPDQIVLVMPSDHVIADLAALGRTVAAGCAAAADGFLTIFGIRPDGPDTGYGYIKSGEALAGIDGAHRVDTFTEKPDRARAEEMLAEGGWLWNSGMFLFRAGDCLKAFETHAPDILAACRASVAGAAKDLDFLRLGAGAWDSVASAPFDKAIVEKIDTAAVIHADMGWSDVGTWPAIARTGQADTDGNVVSANVVAIDASNSLIRSEGPLVAALGISDLTIVATQDAVLVASSERAQDVRLLTDAMQAEDRAELAGSSITYRPWGHFENIDEGDHFKVKRIVVTPGHSLSRQMHHHRAEHWVVVSGVASVLRGEEEFEVRSNESVYIPVETVHRLANNGDEPLQLIEIQTGDYLEEDDIVRFDDVYGRT